MTQKNNNKKPAILIVDDDINGDLEALPVLLEMEGFDVYKASSHSETTKRLKYIKEQDLSLDIAIVDMILADFNKGESDKNVSPRKGGEKTITLIRNDFPNIPIIILTVVSQELLPASLRSFKTLNKPVNFEKLIEEIKKMI